MIELDLEELRGWFGFGVAGNFAGHLEQAGEAVDFVNVDQRGQPPPRGFSLGTHPVTTASSVSFRCRTTR